MLNEYKESRRQSAQKLFFWDNATHDLLVVIFQPNSTPETQRKR